LDKLVEQIVKFITAGFAFVSHGGRVKVEDADDFRA
jgi:hypothetical protein